MDLECFTDETDIFYLANLSNSVFLRGYNYIIRYFASQATLP